MRMCRGLLATTPAAHRFKCGGVDYGNSACEMLTRWKSQCPSALFHAHIQSNVWFFDGSSASAPYETPFSQRRDVRLHIVITWLLSRRLEMMKINICWIDYRKQVVVIILWQPLRLAGDSYSKSPWYRLGQHLTLSSWHEKITVTSMKTQTVLNVHWIRVIDGNTVQIRTIIWNGRFGRLGISNICFAFTVL